MAINQTEKRQTLARQCVQTAPLLMNVLYSLDALRAQRANGGPAGGPLVFTDADFAGVSGLQHLDAATINAFFAAIPTLLTAFANQGFDEVFESLRP
jgi:hypothetical protein